MNLLNTRVDGAGALYHEIIRAGLPTEIKTHMAYGGEEPDDTTEFIDFVRRMGKRHQEHQRMTEGERKDSSKPDTKDPTSTTKPPRQSKVSKASSAPTSTSNKTAGPATSSKQAAPKPAGAGWKDKEECRKGVPADMQKSRHENDQCTCW